MRWLLLVTGAVVCDMYTLDMCAPACDSTGELSRRCGQSLCAECPHGAECKAGGVQRHPQLPNHQPTGTDNIGLCECRSAPMEFASDDLPLVLGIAIGVPLGAAYLAVHNGVLAV